MAQEGAHYEPSPGEIITSESEMTEAQAKFSKLREDSFLKLKEMGVTGYLARNSGSGGIKTTEGVINGHDVWLQTAPNPYGSEELSGKIDETPLAPKEVAAILEKYKDATVYYESFELEKSKDIEEGTKEMKKKQLLSEIGI